MANWWLGKHAGLPAGTWSSIGKKFGIGLSDQEKVDRARQRRMSFGDISPQEQLMVARGELDPRTGQIGEGIWRGAPNPARVASRYSAGHRARGRMDAEGNITAPFIGPRQEGDFGSGKPLNEWTSSEVKELQRNLKHAGYLDHYGNEIEDDGKLGPLTISAMRNAQAGRKGMAAGEVGGPRGDFSASTSGSGTQEHAISTGARTPSRGTSDKHVPGGVAPGENFEPTIGSAAKEAWGDYFKGEEGLWPDRWQW